MQPAETTSMRHFLASLSCIAMLTAALPVHAEAQAASLQEQINRRYAPYFGPDSQALLPFPRIELQDWKNLHASRMLQRIYTEPGKYYNSKVYTFTLYQAADDGSYYLDAKGGFWGMDELIYGPIQRQQLELAP